MLGLIEGLVTLGDALHLGTRSKKVGAFCKSYTIKVKEKFSHVKKDEDPPQEKVVGSERENTD
jgi:hypothetical protein